MFGRLKRLPARSKNSPPITKIWPLDRGPVNEPSQVQFRTVLHALPDPNIVIHPPHGIECPFDEAMLVHQHVRGFHFRFIPDGRCSGVSHIVIHRVYGCITMLRDPGKT